MSRPWMPLYVADYLADTAHLRALESGAYLHLIMHYWQHGELPNDDYQLSAIARLTPQEWKRSRPIIAPFFQAGWKHKRIAAELAKAEAKYQRRAEAGKLGGIAKSDGRKKPSNATPSDEAMLYQPQLQKKDSEADASDAGASSRLHDYPNDRARLYGEGKLALIALGVREQTTGGVIGRWLKTVNDDCRTVLDAIMRARERCVADPIAWITAALKPTEKPHGQPRKSQFVSAAERLIESIDRQSGASGDAGAREARGPPRDTHARLLSAR